MLEFIRWNID